jgi:hypothetical protein
MASSDWSDPDTLRFVPHGAQRLRSAMTNAERRGLDAALAGLPPDRAGIRLRENAALRPSLAKDGPVGAVAASILGGGSHPVRAILFDKTAAANWSLAWHQDRTVAVAGRIEVEGFGPWTLKHGLLHVAPPFAVLAGMVTLRVHLDPVPVTNAPLLVAPGSHRLGRIAEAEVADVVKRCGTAACIADAGDIWLYATPILHASEAARTPVRRRVLQVDFAAGDLPGGLEWVGL